MGYKTEIEYRSLAGTADEVAEELTTLSKDGWEVVSSHGGFLETPDSPGAYTASLLVLASKMTVTRDGEDTAQDRFMGMGMKTT